LKCLKLICATAAMLGIVLTMSSCRGSSVLVVGVDINQVPLSFRDSNNSVSGFEIDLATEAAKRAGLTVRFVPINWVQREKALNSNEVNSLWGEDTAAPEEKNDILFTKPYMYNNQILIVLSDSNINTKEDLADKTIGVITGSKAADALKGDSITGMLAGGAPQFYDDNKTLFLALEANQIDAVAVDETMGDYYVNQNTVEYKILSGTLSTEQYSIGVRRNDSQLRNSMQKALDSMKKDGTSKSISIKWFNKNYT
jgi:polar amino acid transport system substrate-binding protein